MIIEREKATTINTSEHRDLVMLYDHDALPPDVLTRPKNMEVATRLARLMGGKVVAREAAQSKGLFGLPFDAVERETADSFGMNQRGDLYGAVVQHVRHADKVMLHPLVDADKSPRPDWYTDALATSCDTSTLYGFSAFSLQDAKAAYEKISEKYGPAVRVKDGCGVGGWDQFVMHHGSELEKLVDSRPDLLDNGMVLEPNLNTYSAVTVTSIFFKGEEYAWAGKPWSVVHDGLVRFGGNEIICARGGLAALRKAVANRKDLARAVDQTAEVHSAYDLLGATVSRAAYDVIQGSTTSGDQVEGVIDPSLRPSGSSPAEIRSIEAFQANDQDVIHAGVRYHYEPEDWEQAQDSKDLFASSRYVAITAYAEAKNQ